MFRNILNFVDNFLNKTTMYRLVLYYLLFLFAAALILSFFGILPYNYFALLFSAFYIICISWVTNTVFARVFKAPTNVESVYITALILVLIITPIRPPYDFQYLSLAGWAAVWAMAAKYIFAIRKKHLFNPAAFAVALTAATLGQSATWWVGTLSMAPFVLLGGLLVVRKIRRLDLVLGFTVTALATILWFSFSKGTDIFVAAWKTLSESPLLFFVFVMLTEPLTTPPTKPLRTLYGALVGFLFAPGIHISSLYSTPELALLAGNIFSYIVSPKEKLFLRLKERIRVTPDVYDLVFESDREFTFKPGQYLEWTLSHGRTDRRGNRRYFTIASSPTEKEIRLGVKFYQASSSFKMKLMSMKTGDGIIASGRAGDFVLPRNKNKKLVFVAGGIGITPFRSMTKYLLDRNEKRSVVLLYSNKTADDIAYKEIFDEAEERLGMKTVYTLTEVGSIPPEWRGVKGFIDEEMIKKEIPDYKERLFYLSGPHSMVVAFETVLKKMGVKSRQIKKDFFPGFV